MAIKWKDIAIDFVIVAILANMAVLAKCHQNQQTEVFQLHVYFPERFLIRVPNSSFHGKSFLFWHQASGHAFAN